MTVKLIDYSSGILLVLVQIYLHNLNTYNHFCAKAVHATMLFIVLFEYFILFFLSPWKFEHISIGFLSLLLRDDRILPVRAIKFFVQCLNHDAIVVRKVKTA